jgi:cell division protein FtsN
MTVILLGYPSHDKTADPVCLYAGRDNSTARSIQEAPPVGIVRSEIYVNPVVNRRRIHEGNEAKPEPLPEPALAPVPAKAPAPHADDKKPKPAPKAKADDDDSTD